ncbi:MAG TPA: hypothetical protein VHB50_21715, partial [Bryobacteraceae bacterium]|nr:hypothetical protein [Bryobacteraceae bacterium]
VARACRLALETPRADGHVFNIATGRRMSVSECAQKMAAALGKDHIKPEITGKYRVGDIRHCYADISLARDVLGYEPQMKLEDGMVNLAEWLSRQTAFDRVAEARQELTSRGLMV